MFYTKLTRWWENNWQLLLRRLWLTMMMRRACGHLTNWNRRCKANRKDRMLINLIGHWWRKWRRGWENICMKKLKKFIRRNRRRKKKSSSLEKSSLRKFFMDGNWGKKRKSNRKKMKKNIKRGWSKTLSRSKDKMPIENLKSGLLIILKKKKKSRWLKKKKSKKNVTSKIKRSGLEKENRKWPKNLTETGSKVKVQVPKKKVGIQNSFSDTLSKTRSELFKFY